jgi:predicted dehydrogenase
MKIYRLGIVGAGRWAENYCKTIAVMPNVELAAMARRKNVRPDFIQTSCKLINNWQDFYRKEFEYLDGIIVATDFPFTFVHDYLHYKIPVLAEKPVITNSSFIESLEISNDAGDNKLLVNYIHLFSDPFQELKKIIGDNKIIRICSSGFGPSKTRETFSPLWDYGPHDLSMILSLIKTDPTDIHIQTHNKTRAGHSFIINLQFGDIKTKSIVGNGTIIKSRYLSVTYDEDGKENSITYNDMSPNKLFLNGSSITYPITATPLENSITGFLGLIDGRQDERYGTDLTTKITKILSTYEEQ